MEEEHSVAMEEAKEQGREEIVRNLLSSQKLTVEEIANFALVTESLVRKIKEEMKNGS